MALNLNKNRTALLAAYEDVCSEKSSTSWALFSYEGNSNDLKLVMCGANGLEEMVEELNSGKVMYAFCKVKDSKAGLCKYVLINWIGEGVSDGRKGTCANHVNSVANFFKGAHVTINARAEEDVEPEVIMEKVGKAAGVTFGLQQESACFVDNAPRKPVGSVYQKTNAAVEIKRVKNDGFWARAEREEKLRKEEERLRAAEQRQREEEERQERERQEAGERERRFLEKAREIDELKKYQEKADSEDRSKEKQKWEQDEIDYQQRMRRGYKKSESVEKAAEAATVIQQRSLNPREIFKQKERAMSYDHTTPTPYSPGKLKSPFLRKEGSLPAWECSAPRGSGKVSPTVFEIPEFEASTDVDSHRPADKRQAASPERSSRQTSPPRAATAAAASPPSQSRSESQAPAAEKRAASPPPSISASPPPPSPPQPKKQLPQQQQQQPQQQQPLKQKASPTRAPQVNDEQVFPSQATPAAAAPPASPQTPPLSPAGRTSTAAVLQKAQALWRPEEEEQERPDDNDWDDEHQPTANAYYPHQAGNNNGTERPAAHVEQPGQETAQADAFGYYYSQYQDQQAYQQDGYLQESADGYPTEQYDLEGKGQCARALYDYQAADETEITFDPDDLITHIDQIDEGWWRGYGPDGRYGLFPANYVQLLN